MSIGKTLLMVFTMRFIMKKYKKLIRILKAYDISQSNYIGAIKNYDDWAEFIDNIDKSINSKSWRWLTKEGKK